MRPFRSSAAALAVLAATAPLAQPGAAWSQPAKGAPAAFERARDVMAQRFRDEKLSGDPDQDFAALLRAAYEQLMFLSKTQLEYGGDRHLRDVAQKTQDDQQKLIDDLKNWQLRSRLAGYKAQPDQPQPGSGPLDTVSGLPAAVAPVTPQAAAAPAEASPAPQSDSNAPFVSGTVKKVDTASGKVTLDHERIPNIDMDAMTMAYKVQTPSLLAGLKPGDKVRFSAEEVNGQALITRIRPSR